MTVCEMQHIFDIAEERYLESCDGWGFPSVDLDFQKTEVIRCESKPDRSATLVICDEDGVAHVEAYVNGDQFEIQVIMDLLDVENKWVPTEDEEKVNWKKDGF